MVGQVSMPNVLEAVYVEGIIRMDGRLDESEWATAPRISNFTQRELFEDMPATERTEVAVLYNNQTMYIGVWCYDSEPDKIIAKEMKRDFNDNLDDNVKIIIDTYNDKRNGFLFIVNPNGARADLQVFDNGSSVNRFWNGVWDVRTTRTSEGWFAEIEIPLPTLKFRDDKEGKSRVWGFNVERNIRRKREQVFWQGWSRDSRIEQVNRAGQLVGLGNLQNKAFIEYKPYAIGGTSNVGNDGEFQGTANAGGDINYLISPTYRLNITLNTDFAEVESDREQINLTRFPLFFPELREFFLEGADYFDFGFGGNRIIPFYSRSIGLDSNRQSVPIIGGARLLGKEGGSTLGLMSIQTASTDIEPFTNYTVGSWRQDVLEQSTVGMMTVNKITPEGWHTTTGGNFRYATDKLFGRRNFNVGAAYIRTYDSYGEWLPDAFAYRAYLSYPNDLINIFASAQRSPEGFNPRAGLQLREDFQEYFATIALRPRPNPNGMFSWIRQWDFSPGVFTYTLFDDTRKIQSFLYEIRPLGFSTRSGEFFTFAIDRFAEGLIDDFIIYRPQGREDEWITISPGEFWYTRYRLQAGTFSSRTLSATLRFSAGEFYSGTSIQQVWEARWRTSPYLTISSSVEWNDVKLKEGSFNNQLVGTRLEYAINPRVFGLVYAQVNRDADLFVFNFRLQWIPIIGADFFFIVNHIVNNSEILMQEPNTQILGKLIWRFAR